MANLIILEGVSRTGKSSIAKSLSEKFGFRCISIKHKNPEYIKNLPDFYQGMQVYANEIFRAFPDETFILDRSFISELVYAKAFERDSYITEDRVVADLLHDNNFTIINLTSTHETYLQRIPKDKKIYTFCQYAKQKDLFYYFYEHYKKYYDSKQWQSRFIELDTNYHSIEQCEEHIIKLLENNSILKTTI
jgi:thymidylate kinase